jgi:hypothetical protein
MLLPRVWHLIRLSGSFQEGDCSESPDQSTRLSRIPFRPETGMDIQGFVLPTNIRGKENDTSMSAASIDDVKKLTSRQVKANDQTSAFSMNRSLVMISPRLTSAISGGLQRTAWLTCELPESISKRGFGFRIVDSPKSVILPVMSG